MANFAVIENNVVTNVIVADNQKIAEEVTGKTCVEYTEKNSAYIGGIYDGTTFAQPIPKPIEPTTEEKLTALGLTKADLKALLA